MTHSDNYTGRKRPRYTTHTILSMAVYERTIHMPGAPAPTDAGQVEPTFRDYSITVNPRQRFHHW